MGSSGSGKSTLLNCIITVIKPDSGNLPELQGKEIQALKGAKLAQYRGREIGYLFQNFELLDNLTGREHHGFPCPYTVCLRTRAEADWKSSHHIWR